MTGGRRGREGWSGDQLESRARIEVRMANSTPPHEWNSVQRAEFRAIGKWNHGKEISGEEMGVSRDAG